MSLKLRQILQDRPQLHVIGTAGDERGSSRDDFHMAEHMKLIHEKERLQPRRRRAGHALHRVDRKIDKKPEPPAAHRHARCRQAQINGHTFRRALERREFEALAGERAIQSRQVQKLRMALRRRKDRATFIFRLFKKIGGRALDNRRGFAVESLRIVEHLDMQAVVASSLLVPVPDCRALH